MIGKLGQAMTNGKSGSSSAVLAGRLIKDVSEMMGNRFLTESQFLGDLVVGQPLRHQVQHLHLSRCEPSRVDRFAFTCGGWLRQRVSQLIRRIPAPVVPAPVPASCFVPQPRR